MLSEMLKEIASSMSQTCPFPVRVGRVLPRVEVRYPVVAISYAGTTETAEFVYHKARVSCYVRVPYQKIEDGEAKIIEFVDWILQNREMIIEVNGSLQTVMFNLDSYNSASYLDDNAFVILEASFLVLIPE